MPDPNAPSLPPKSARTAASGPSGSSSPPTGASTAGRCWSPPRAASEQQRQQQADAPLAPVLLIEIKPDDGPVMRFFKHIIRGGQLAFAAIMAFLVWLVTVAAG